MHAAALVEHLTVLAPGVFGVTVFVLLFGAYCVRAARGSVRDLGAVKANEILGPFWGGFMAWLLRPLERTLLVVGVAPTQITVASLVLCVGAGVAIGAGMLGTGAWLFIGSGMLDILDGRIARAADRQSRAGALFDSVADRWGELALFAGFAWYLRSSGAWLLAVLLAGAGSFMVSYTRARAEALGVELRTGAMQRAERILLVSVSTLVAAWCDAADSSRYLVPYVLGLALATCGVLSCATAIGRWHAAHRALQREDAPRAELAIERAAVSPPNHGAVVRARP